MTENEAKAIRFIENIKSHAMATLDYIAKEEPNVSPLVYKGREEKADTILTMIEELKQYRAIGTLEECRAAMERQNPRAAIAEKEDTGTTKYTCPTCGMYMGWSTGTFPARYCWKCGQKLDWSDEE